MPTTLTDLGSTEIISWGIPGASAWKLWACAAPLLLTGHSHDRASVGFQKVCTSLSGSSVTDTCAHLCSHNLLVNVDYTVAGYNTILATTCSMCQVHAGTHQNPKLHFTSACCLHTLSPCIQEKKKKKCRHLTSFSQPARLTTCAYHGNSVM